MKKRTSKQIQKDYRDTLIEKSREIIEENRKQIYHQHWQSIRDAHREARDFFRTID